MHSEIVMTELARHLSITEQIKLAVTQDWDQKQVEKTFGPATTTDRVHRLAQPGALVVHKGAVIGDSDIRHAVKSGAAMDAHLITKAAIQAGAATSLVSPGIAATPLMAVTTPSLITALAQGGAFSLPPNVFLTTQATALAGVEILEGNAIPAAMPALGFVLSSFRKFGLILSFSKEMLSATNFDGRVVAFMEAALTDAANNATDLFLVNLMTTGGTAAATVAAAIKAFVGDLRTAVWIASPATLASLQSAINPNVGPSGGIFMTLPALPTLAAPAGKLFLVDRARLGVYDGPSEIVGTTQASIIMDSAPGTATSTPVSMFGNSLMGLKIIKHADAHLLSAPQVISL